MKDENDKLIAGELPTDPADGCPIVAGEENAMAPVVSVQEGIRSAAERAVSPRPRCISTGNRDLDDMTGGFLPGEVWVMGADTNWGKSSWLVSVADDAVRAGHNPLIVTAEDSEDIFFDRLLVRRAGISAKRFRQRCLDADELYRVAAVEKAAEPKPFILNAIGRDVEWVCEQLERIVPAYGINFVGVDYIQELRSRKRHDRDDLRIEHVASELRMMVKRLRITGCLFTQLTLGTDRDGSTARPTKLATRGSKSVAHGAEMVALGWTAPEGGVEINGVEYATGERLMLIDKGKQCGKGAVRLYWDDKSACFRRSPEEQELESLTAGFGSSLMSSGGF